MSVSIIENAIHENPCSVKYGQMLDLGYGGWDLG